MKLRICAATVALGLFASLSVQGRNGVTAINGDRAILSIAHVTRHGGKTGETSMAVMRDHKYYLELVDQKQPSPHPNCEQSLGVLSDHGFQRITLLVDSPQFHRLRNSSGTIGHQDGDFWYISMPRETGTQFVAFRTEDTNTPDVVKHLIAWFEETEKLKPHESSSLRDSRCSVFSDETADFWRR
jgi:hypothetical protein